MQQRVRDLFDSGKSGYQIAKELGVSRTQIYRLLKRSGIRPIDHMEGRYERMRILSNADVERIIHLYNMEKHSLKRLGEMFKCSMQTIRKYLLESGVKMSPKGRHFREFSDSEMEEIRTKWLAGESQTAIAQEYGSSQTVIGRVLNRLNLGIETRRPRGQRHGSWKGGTPMIGGYRMVLLSPDHKFFSNMAMRSGYVMEHRLVMAEYLGRPLLPEETVHHKNGDKIDNRIENLELRAGRHGAGVRCFCANCGSENIVFK